MAPLHWLVVLTIMVLLLCGKKIRDLIGPRS
jgi:Sec-independent protein translocase protein TatA